MRSRSLFLTFGVRPPLPEEAPSSWISSLALAQGCSLAEMFEFLGLRSGGDMDFELRGAALSELRARCGLPSTAFAIAERVMTRIGDAGLRGELLYVDDRGEPRSRFCPLCLKERRPATLSIFWRFVDWRRCPDHHCLMEKRCLACGRSVRYPRDMTFSRAGREGHASQHRCQHCSADLSLLSPCVVSQTYIDGLPAREADWIQGGCELIKALAEPTLRRWGDESPENLKRPPGPTSVPTFLQWRRLERRLRARSNPDDKFKPDDSRNICLRRHDWGHKVFGTEPPSPQAAELAALRLLLSHRRTL